MSTLALSDPNHRRELGGGLVLRWSTAADTERLAALYSDVFRNKASDPPNTRTAAWTRDLLSGNHPLIDPGDFALVEDTERGTIVAATCLLAQVWEYSGVQFPVGRPEIVGTHADYRNRGLIRAIFELIHARSTVNGQIAQGITGIPYYYRQFGYEYAFDLGGSRKIAFDAIPKLKEGQPEPYTLRDATAVDIPDILALYEHERSRATLSTRIDPEYWRFTLDGHSPESGEGWRTHLISAREANETLGYVLTRRMLWSDTLWICGLSMPHAPLLTAMPGVMRQLQALVPSVPRAKAEQPPPARLSFELGRAHPVYTVLDEALQPSAPQPYGWYVRVPDLPGFITRIAPVLEQRLAGSAAAGYSGELKLTFYRGGLRLVFADGRLTDAEPWHAPVQESGAMGGFPPLVFLQLLFGHRSLAELRYAFPDVWADETGRVLLETLFPPQLAWVLNLD